MYGSGYAVTIAKTQVEYNGKAQKPKLTVTYGRKKLKTKYYTVKYSANKNPGLATAVVKGKGTYAKKIPATKIQFVITPKKMKITSVKSSKAGTAIVRWKTDKYAAGYQLQISTHGKFKANVNTRDLVRTKGSENIPGLQRKKKYYVRIRPYINIKNTVLYGTWSKTGQVKIK